MNSLINWQVAEARAEELRRIEAARSAHPIVRRVHRRRRRRAG